MDRAHYEVAKVRLEEVTRVLRFEKISPEERVRFEREGKELAGIIMSPWFPFGWGYRIAMLFFTAVGLWGLSEGNYLLLLFWLLPPVFSPRIVGGFLGTISGLKDL
jgi:hypothetical protein